MNIFDLFPLKLNEKTRLNNRNTFKLANTDIYTGVVLESLIDFAENTVTKVIKRKEFYVFENNTYKNISKLPKAHPVRRNFKLYQAIQNF